MMEDQVGGFRDPNIYGSEILNHRSYGESLVAAARSDPRIVCLGADLTVPTECQQFRDGLPDRYFMIGMQEANMIGVAAGMARMGEIPFAHSFCVFLTRRVYDQIAMQVAYPRANVKLAGFVPGVTTPLGVSHQAIDDVALMRALPNMTIIEPAGPEQIEAAVTAAIAHQGPVYLRLMMGGQSVAHDDRREALTIGKGQVLREGSDVAIIASGIMVDESLAAAKLLGERKCSATVVNLHTIKPLDVDLIREIATSHAAIVTAENHSVIGGLGSAVAETLLELGLAPRFSRIGLQDCFAMGGQTRFLMQKFGLDADTIATRCLSLCQR